MERIGSIGNDKILQNAFAVSVKLRDQYFSKMRTKNNKYKMIETALLNHDLGKMMVYAQLG